jgi:hypothetical protein
MIDFTKIQTVPVPPPITTLQKANANLTTENKLIKRLMYVGVGIIALYAIYKIYKRHEENDTNEKNQFPRN